MVSVAATEDRPGNNRKLRQSCQGTKKNVALFADNGVWANDEYCLGISRHSGSTTRLPNDQPRIT